MAGIVVGGADTVIGEEGGVTVAGTTAVGVTVVMRTVIATGAVTAGFVIGIAIVAGITNCLFELAEYSDTRRQRRVFALVIAN